MYMIASLIVHDSLTFQSDWSVFIAATKVDREAIYTHVMWVSIMRFMHIASYMMLYSLSSSIAKNYVSITYIVIMLSSYHIAS